MEQEKIQQLEQRIAELEKVLKEHQHLGKDGSKEFSGMTKIEAKEIEIHGAGDNIGDFVIIPSKIFDGKKGEKRVAGSGIATFSEKGSFNEQIQQLIIVGKSPSENFTTTNTTDFDEVNYAMLTLAHSPQGVQNSFGPTSFPPNAFLTAERTPIITGSGTISGNLISDTTANFKNNLAGSIVVLSSGETKKITSNTNTIITLDSNWATPSGTYTYQVRTPIFLGGSNIPFTRLYIGDDIRLGYGSSGGSQVQYIKWGTGSPEGVVIANIGSLYLRSDGSTSTTLYIKTANNGSAQGWTAK
jgi:hypothetical protein